MSREELLGPLARLPLWALGVGLGLGLFIAQCEKPSLL